MRVKTFTHTVQGWTSYRKWRMDTPTQVRLDADAGFGAFDTFHIVYGLH